MLTDIFLFAVGILVGGMNSVAGGGMLLGFPALLTTGMSALSANATANIIILPAQLASAFGYRRSLRKIPKRYFVLLIPCAIGALVGAILLRHTSNSFFERLAAGLVLFAVALFTLQPQIQAWINRRTHHRQGPVNRLPSWLMIALLPLALYGGFFGAGTGFILLAFLAFTNLRDIHQMNALKNLAAAVMALLSIVGLYSADLIDWRRGLIMAVGSVVGGYGGAALAQKFSARGLKPIIIAIGLITAVYFIVHDH